MALPSYVRALRSRNISLTIISAPFMALANSFYGWMVPILVFRSVGGGALGYFYALAYLTSAPLSFISGSIADIVGRKKVIVSTTSLTLISLTLIFVDPYSWQLLLVALVLFALSSVLAMPAASSLIAESVEEKLRPHAFSVTTFATMASSALGSLALGFLAFEDVKLAIIYAAAFSLIALITRFFLFETLSKPRSGDIRMQLRELLGGFKELAKLSGILAFLAAITYIGSVASAVHGVYFPAFLAQEVKLDERMIGLVFSVTSVLSMASIVAGFIVEKTGTVKALAFCLACMSFPNIAMYFAPEYGLFYVLPLISLSTSASAISNVASNTLIADIFKSEIRGRAFGALVSVAVLASIVGPLIGSLITMSLGLRFTPVFVGASFAFSLILFLMVRMYLR